MEAAMQRNRQETRQCRICLDDHAPDEMISPCMCSGSIKYVHRHCLDEWRTTGLGLSNVTTCPVCKFKYILEDAGEQKFSPVVVKVTFILLVYVIKGLIGIVASGYLAKLALKWSGSTAPAIFWPASHLYLRSWAKEHFGIGALVFFALIGFYSILRGFFLWATGRGGADEDVNRYQRRMHGGAPAPRQHPGGGIEIDHDDNDGWGNDNYRGSHDMCPYFFVSGRSGGGGFSSGPSSSSSSSSSDSGCCSSDSKKDCGQAVLIFLAVVGMLVVIAAVFISVYKTIQEENKQARKYMARQLRVVDLDKIDH
eukprot:TRINITY_DN11406_c0_g1_i1.p1 TRINITY_DN11406_c0_g1~~TRINITY_DN11406_c0_g1_i1.p1  ORF type:complete len:310 (+),score=41.59 TRINITY_DN11406_c0_g1_i1:2-931(+)